MRRVFKDLVGRSSKILDLRGPPPAPADSWWCAGREEDFDCVCADAAHGPTDIDNNPLTGLYAQGDTWWADGGAGDLSPVRARAAFEWSVGFMFPDWREDLRAAAARAGPLDAVVFDLVHWDASFSTLARFEHELLDASAALAAAFPPPTRLVYRTPSYFAGDDAGAYNDKNKGRRWNSRAKIERMHELALAALRAGPLRDRLLVWDVYAIGAARPHATTVGQIAACPNGHERSEDVALANQVLLNLLCDS